VTPFAPKLKFIDAHANPDTERDKLAPDIGVYSINDEPQGNTKTDFSKMELFVEFKKADTSDPFRDPKDPLRPKEGNFRFENDLDDAQLVRGQLASYAAAHTGCQFRIHIFSVLVCGTYARFIRWDRDGTTVTRRFNYIKNPHLLADFFWRYDHLDRLQQGHDTSVSSLTPENFQQIQHFESRLRDDNPVIVNSVYSWFQNVMSLKSKSDLSYHFLQSTRLGHRSDEPLDQCWLLIWRRERSSS
jgi:hypothetical protein